MAFARTRPLGQDILPERRVALPQFGLSLGEFRGIPQQISDHLGERVRDILWHECRRNCVRLDLIQEDFLRLGHEFKPLATCRRVTLHSAPWSDLVNWSWSPPELVSDRLSTIAQIHNLF